MAQPARRAAAQGADPPHARDLLAIIAECPRPPVVVAHSFGSNPTMLAAIMQPRAFAGLGLLMAGTLPGPLNLAACNGLYLVLLVTGGMVVPFEELSVVSAPYVVDGRVVGTLGVIGPTRMAYDRMIQIVDITSRLVSNALSAPR